MGKVAQGITFARRQGIDALPRGRREPLVRITVFWWQIMLQGVQLYQRATRLFGVSVFSNSSVFSTHEEFSLFLSGPGYSRSISFLFPFNYYMK